jgi:trans-2,3-dihydro-3-hydroxyanthranilate isomerase
MQVDVFTQTPLEGNPCAVIFDTDDMDETLMLAVAREMNLSETVFLKTPSASDFKARYFTPKEEIPLAGHPTIATIHCLIESGKISCEKLPLSVSLELTAGKIRVDVERKEDGHQIVMYQLKPQFMKEYPASEVMPLFGLTTEDWLPGAPIQTVSTGTPMLMIPVKNHESLRKAELQLAKYIDYKKQGDFFSPQLFCLQGITPGADTFARHFSTPPDNYEDPYTGSAAGCMVAYLWHRRLVDKPRVVAEQGHWMDRPGSAELEAVGSPDAIEAIKLYGQAVTTMIGELILP